MVMMTDVTVGTNGTMIVTEGTGARSTDKR